MSSTQHTAESVRQQLAFSPLDKSRRLFLFVFLSLVGLASGCAIFYITVHMQAVNLGYKIHDEGKKKESLIDENKRLNLEIARLKSLTRLEHEARNELGMSLPKTGQVFYLSQWEPKDRLPEIENIGKPLKPDSAPPAPLKVVSVPSRFPGVSQREKSPLGSNPASAPKSSKPKVLAGNPSAKSSFPKQLAAKPHHLVGKKSPLPKAVATQKNVTNTKIANAKASEKKPSSQSVSNKKIEKRTTVTKVVINTSSAANKPRPTPAQSQKERVPAVMLDPMP